MQQQAKEVQQQANLVLLPNKDTVVYVVPEILLNLDLSRAGELV